MRKADTYRGARRNACLRGEPKRIWDHTCVLSDPKARKTIPVRVYGKKYPYGSVRQGFHPVALPSFKPFTFSR